MRYTNVSGNCIQDVLPESSYHKRYQYKYQCASQIRVPEMFGFAVWIVDYCQNQFLLVKEKTKKKQKTI